MGRGRAKAKQTKVARRLKYGGAAGTDLTRLQAELAAERGDLVDDVDDPLADLADDELDDDELDDVDETSAD